MSSYPPPRAAVPDAARLTAVCWKPVELRATADPLTGEVRPDPPSLGVSPADEAALEWALRSAERFGGGVRVVAAGDGRCEAILRTAAEVGVRDLVHVTCDPVWPSAWVASAIAPHVAGADLVWCGDVSADRGSGSVPAFLAAELRIAQALGLTAVDLAAGAVPTGGGTEDGRRFEVVRRLDGGRRERLAIEGRTVLSTEGGTARLRRGSFGSAVAARQSPITRAVAPAPAPAGSSVAPEVRSVGPWRPPARAVPPPSGSAASERIRALIGVTSQSRTARAAVRLEPEAAARTILEALSAWGERP